MCCSFVHLEKGPKRGTVALHEKVQSKEEANAAMKRMKTGKAVGPLDRPVEVWRCLEERAVGLFTILFSYTLDSERMPGR